MKLALLVVLLLNITLQTIAQKDSGTFYYNIANTNYTEKKYSVAEKNYLRSITFNPNNVNGHTELAQCYMAMKQYNKATETFKNIEKLDANNAMALENLVTMSYNNFKWDDAIAYGKKCLALKIGKGINYKIAKSYYKLEDLSNSSKYLQAAANEDPTNADVPYTMAEIWLDANNTKRALEMYEIALSIDTTKATWYYETASTYETINNFAKAAAYYQKAIDKGITNDLSMQTTLGIVLLNNGNFEKGNTLLEKVVAKKPLDKVLLNNIAYTYYTKKKYNNAIEWWDKILHIDKNDAKTLYMIGMAYQKDGNDAKGKKLCDVAITMDPTLASMRKEMQQPLNMGL